MNTPGTVVFGSPKTVQYKSLWRTVEGIERRSCVWHSAVELGLPEKLVLAYDCDVGLDGIRRFLPIGGANGYLRLAVEPGLLILSREHEFTREQGGSYRIMSLFFRLVRSWQDHLRRNFTHPRDFVVTASGRGGEIRRSLLPDGVRLRPGDKGPPPIDAMIDAGRNAAIRDGIAAPAMKDAIRYGLEQLATNWKLQLRLNEVRPLVRLALFDIGATEPQSESFLELVTERLLIAISAHHDDSHDEFDRWFFPGHGNLVRAIANQRGGPGGNLDHSQVRQAILDIGWRAYEYVAQCVTAYARGFVASLDKPLNPEEQRLFGDMYLPKPYFGDLPLVMLMERQSLISGVVTRIWNSTNNAHEIEILHGLLGIYSEMVTNRRQADRQIQRRRRRNSDGPAIEITGFDSNLHAAPSSAPSDFRFDAMGDAIAAARGEHCPACAHWGWRQHDPSADASASPVTIEIACEGEHIKRVVAYTLDELRDLTNSHV